VAAVGTLVILKVVDLAIGLRFRNHEVQDLICPSMARKILLGIAGIVGSTVQ